ncbi:MAG: hypothetical protein V4481_03720 [Patescibacteria group bacterium]
MPRIITRIIIDIAILLCLIHGWGFVALPLGIVGALVFPFYIELILAGVMYDALFGFTAGQGFAGYLGTIISTVFIFIVIIIKKIMR